MQVPLNSWEPCLAKRS